MTLGFVVALDLAATLGFVVALDLAVTLGFAALDVVIRGVHHRAAPPSACSFVLATRLCPSGIA